MVFAHSPCRTYAAVMLPTASSSRAAIATNTRRFLSVTVLGTASTYSGGTCSSPASKPPGHESAPWPDPSCTMWNAA
jgi:hypothetical protein